MGGMMAIPDQVDDAIREVAERDRNSPPVVEKKMDAPKGLSLQSPRVLENLALMVLNSMGISRERLGEYFFQWLETATTYVEEEFASDQIKKPLKILGKGVWDEMKIDRIRCSIILNKTLEYTLNSVEA